MQNNFMPSKAVVIAVTSFLLVVLICSLYSIPVVVAKPNVTKGPVQCIYYNQYEVFITCCQTQTDKQGIEITYCTECNNTSPPSNCGPRYQAHGEGVNPPGLPTPAGGATNALPPSGNNSGTPGTSIFNPVRNATNAVPSSNGTSTPPPGSIIKVPPGTVGSATNPSNTTGTASLGNIIKVPVNHTNAIPTGNNTGTPPPSSTALAGQQPQTQQTTGHHHKGSNTGASTSTGNSTGH